MSEQNAQKQLIPAIQGWFTMPPQAPHIIASRCSSCNGYFFPPAQVCRNPNCKKDRPMESVLLGNRGKLEAYSINYFSPPPPYHAPDPFVPFGVGMVSLPEGISITGQISSGYDEKNLEVGMDMDVVIEKLYEDSQGNDVMAWKFRPAKK
ncbi:MAG: OB-fold domain-containing protein [Dehalococcoidia bacterium]